MNQWQNIQNSFQNWRREQVIWAVVVVLGLLVLGVWFVSAKNAPPVAAPTGTAVVGSTPTPSATPSPSELPTLEALPFELTQSDVDINEPTDEAFGPTDENPEVTESPTFYVRPFSSNTPTVPTAAGGGGGFFPSSTPNSVWTQYARTSTALVKTNAARLTQTATFLRATNQTATEAMKQVKTFSALLTSYARTPRPEQIGYSVSDTVYVLNATPYPIPTPASTPITVAGGTFGDWAPTGLRFVLEIGGELAYHDVNLNGTAKNDANNFIVNQPGGGNSQPNWSPNGSWIVFVNGNPGQVGSRLYRIHWNGLRTSLQQLTSGAYGVAEPDWAPGNNKIIYASQGYLWLMDVSPVPLTTPPVVYQPGGRMMAALVPPQKQPAGGFFSWLFQAETETPTPTATDTATATATSTATFTDTPVATFTATSTATATATSTPTSTATGRPVPLGQQITFISGLNPRWPHIAPNGTTVLFGCYDDDICTVTLNSFAEPARVASAGAGETLSYPFWSRDSNRFGYISTSGGVSTIYIRSLTGGLLARYSVSGEITNPAWRP